MRLPSRLAATVSALSLAAHSACGGGGPAAPTRAVPVTPAAATRLVVVSGETGQPIAGAAVTVDGRGHATDAAGEVLLDELARPGAMVDVVVPGFFDRQTILRVGTSRMSLWPRQSLTGLNEHTTAELVYTPGAQCCPAETVAAAPLRRVHPTIANFTVVLPARYRGNDGIRAAFQEAVSLAGAASGARVVFTLADEGAGPRIDVAVGPDPANRPNVAAVAERQFDAQGYITGGRILFVIEGYLSGERPRWELVTIVAHELGHFLGLGHSTTPGLMSVVAGRGNNYAYFAANRDFSPAEKLVIDLMYDRRSGTRFPDNDRLAAATSAARSDRISCGP
jgi:hypothetical protein